MRLTYPTASDLKGRNFSRFSSDRRPSRADYKYGCAREWNIARAEIGVDCNG